MNAPVNCTPRELLIYLRELAAGSLAVPCSDGKASAQLKSIRIASKCFRSGKVMVHFPGFRFMMTSALLMGNSGGDSLKSSLEDSPVKGTARPGSGKGKQTKGTCGRIQCVSYAKWHPLSRSWKTCRGCFPLIILAKSSETWRRAGTMRNGTLYPRRSSAPRISGKGYGYWPTIGAYEERAEKYTEETSYQHFIEGRQIHLAQAIRDPRLWPISKASRDGTSPETLRMVAAGEAELSLDRAVLLIGTPTACQRKRSGKGRTPNPAELVMLPTPVAYDATPGGPGNHYKGLGHMMKHGGMLLTPSVMESFPWYNQELKEREKTGKQVMLGHLVGGELNPDWVEWLMGWPIGWTACAPLAMGRFPAWLQSHSSSWPAAQASCEELISVKGSAGLFAEVNQQKRT